ncbi:hypothetical protein COBT_003812, partial [Conglomerata obtusa]
MLSKELSKIVLYTALFYVISLTLGFFSSYVLSKKNYNFRFPLFITAMQNLIHFAIAQFCMKLVERRRYFQGGVFYRMRGCDAKEKVNSENEREGDVIGDQEVEKNLGGGVKSDTDNLLGSDMLSIEKVYCKQECVDAKIQSKIFKTVSKQGNFSENKLEEEMQQLTKQHYNKQGNVSENKLEEEMQQLTKQHYNKQES